VPRHSCNKWPLIALGAVLLVCLWMLATTGRREPEHAGKTLGEWLEALHHERWAAAIQNRQEQDNFAAGSGPAAQAIQGMGDQVLPHLLRRLRARETRLTRAQANRVTPPPERHALLRRPP
jgi:hypothetical protein